FLILRPPISTLFPYTTLFRSDRLAVRSEHLEFVLAVSLEVNVQGFPGDGAPHDRVAILPVEKDHVAPENEALHGRWECQVVRFQDRKSTRLNSSHLVISYAVF